MMQSKVYYERAMEFALSKTDEKLEEFQTSFLGGASENYNYIKTPCTGWEEGFWTGMLMLAYEYTGDEKYYAVFNKLNAVMSNRAESRIAVDHHDMGFLYSLSSVADYKVTQGKHSKEIGILAADLLVRRYQPKGGFIQSWGEIGDLDNYALIIDSLNNTPLLFWAAEVTENEKYSDIARRHVITALCNVIRDDGTTYHKFHFNPETGAPLYGKTAQGYADDSCWARGQAWGILGAALNYSYMKDEFLYTYYLKMLEAFEQRLPADYVPYWDMIFGDGSGEPRDTSAAVIAACGILEMNRFFPDERQLLLAEKMVSSITENYLSNKLSQPSNVIVTDGMRFNKIDPTPRALPYGDYYYMEFLMRMLKPEWKMYW